MASTPTIAPDALELQYFFPSGTKVDDHGRGTVSWPDGTGPFGQKRYLEMNGHVANVQGIPQALSADECAIVTAMGTAQPRVDGRVELGDDAYRVSHISWIEPNESNHWLFHKLGVLFKQVNQEFGFGIVGFVDALQYTEYGPGQHFEWHMDIGPGETSLRKLSMTIQLSTPGDYDGGVLEFVGLPTGEQARHQGTAVFFPSYMGHRVTPVTRGIRRSLVAWASGTPFR